MWLRHDRLRRGNYRVLGAGDTYVSRLCMRVARAVQQDGKSELIQGLALATNEAYDASGFAELATNLATARRELTTAMADSDDAIEDGSAEPDAPAAP